MNEPLKDFKRFVLLYDVLEVLLKKKEKEKKSLQCWWFLKPEDFAVSWSHDTLSNTFKLNCHV